MKIPWCCLCVIDSTSAQRQNVMSCLWSFFQFSEGSLTQVAAKDINNILKSPLRLRMHYLILKQHMWTLLPFKSGSWPQNWKRCGHSKTVCILLLICWFLDFDWLHWLRLGSINHKFIWNLVMSWIRLHMRFDIIRQFLLFSSPLFCLKWVEMLTRVLCYRPRALPIILSLWSAYLLLSVGIIQSHSLQVFTKLKCWLVQEKWVWITLCEYSCTFKGKICLQSYL